MRRLFAPDYSLDEYRRILEKMHGFLYVYEPAMFEYLGNSLAATFAHRRKRELLLKDLLNYELTAEQIAALPRCGTPPIANLAQCLGVWYVLEGSTLGGQMIARHLSRQFGAAAAKVTGFHGGYGDRTQAEWQAFCRLMELHLPPEKADEIEEAAQSAKLTFHYLSDWLQDI